MISTLKTWTVTQTNVDGGHKKNAKKYLAKICTVTFVCNK